MVWAFVRVSTCAVVISTVAAILPTKASAVTLSYEYSGTGNLSFQSDTTLNIGGTCLSPCVVSALMTISGSGPAFNPSIPSGWATNASATVTDNLGDTMLLGVNTGNYTSGTKHEVFGGAFFAAALPSSLDISTSSFASILGGPGTIDYSISISLPNGAYVTPLPDALPLFATGLGLFGMLAWWRKRRVPSQSFECGR
jgi:hypothetical protein